MTVERWSLDADEGSDFTTIAGQQAGEGVSSRSRRGVWCGYLGDTGAAAAAATAEQRWTLITNGHATRGTSEPHSLDQMPWLPAADRVITLVSW